MNQLDQWQQVALLVCPRDCVMVEYLLVKCFYFFHYAHFDCLLCKNRSLKSSVEYKGTLKDIVGFGLGGLAWVFSNRPMKRHGNHTSGYPLY